MGEILESHLTYDLARGWRMATGLPERGGGGGEGRGVRDKKRPTCL